MATIVEALQALSARVDALSGQERPDAFAGVVRVHSAQIEAMATRIAALEEVLKAQRATIASLTQQVDRMRAALGEVERLDAGAVAAERPDLRDASTNLLDEAVRVDLEHAVDA